MLFLSPKSLSTDKSTVTSYHMQNLEKMKAQLNVSGSMKTLEEDEWCNKARPFDTKMIEN